jgi:hypothetical protein
MIFCCVTVWLIWLMCLAPSSVWPSHFFSFCSPGLSVGTHCYTSASLYPGLISSSCEHTMNHLVIRLMFMPMMSLITFDYKTPSNISLKQKILCIFNLNLFFFFFFKLMVSYCKAGILLFEPLCQPFFVLGIFFFN